MLELYRGVMYSEFTSQYFVDLVADSLTIRSGHIQNVDVAGKGVGMRTQAPDVYVVDFADSLHAQHCGGHALQAHAFGQTFKQDVGRVNDDIDRRPEDKPRNQESQGGIDDGIPRSADQHRAGNDCHVGKRVAQVVDKHGAQIQIAALTGQSPGDSAVHHQRNEAHHQHRTGSHRFRVHDALVALNAQVNRHRHQQQGVDERDQNARALITERLVTVGRPPLKIEGDPGKDQRGDIRQVVPAIADQRKAVGHAPHHHLRCHKAERNDERNANHPARRIPMMVMVVVLV